MLPVAYIISIGSIFCRRRFCRRIGKGKLQRGVPMSSYNELIKNFERIRAYMREFYVYGFKSREDIVDNIGPTAEIVERIKPIYNFKAAE